MACLRSMSGTNGKRSEAELKDFVNPLYAYKKDVPTRGHNKLRVPHPKANKKAREKSAHEVVGISRKDFAKRKLAAARDCKQGRGVCR